MVEQEFELADPDSCVAVLEETRRDESRLMARQMTAIADLLAHRTAEAEGVDPDPGWSMITGFSRTVAEVGAALHMAPREANKVVACAEALDLRLPRIRDLLAEGHIDFASVRTIVTRTELVEQELIGALDRRLAERIRRWECWSHKRLVNAVDKVILTIDPDAAKERRARADGDRYMKITPQVDGTAKVQGRISATAAAVYERRMDQLVKTVCANDSRTMDQRRADAMQAIAENRTRLDCTCGSDDCPMRTEDPGPQRAVPVVINVIATEATVSGESEEPGYLEGFGVIDADTVRELTEDAKLRPLAEPTVTEERAHRYQPTPAVARWVRYRDLTCRFPFCDRKATICDLDHTTPFNHEDPATGGLTVPSDLAAYCRQHHRLKTFLSGLDGWQDEQLADGTIVWRTPTGRVYRTTPDGPELFPQMRPDCTEPKPRRRNRQRERKARIARMRETLRAQRPVNAAQRNLDRARTKEIELRKWRNESRRWLLLFKGERKSRSPFARWINDPFEPEDLTPDWRPPPDPEPRFDEPPF